MQHEHNKTNKPPRVLKPAEQQTLLREVGLKRAEAKLYCYMMHNPTLVLASELVKATGLASSTVYRLLNNLERKGFVKSRRRYRGKFYHRIRLMHALDNFGYFQHTTALPLLIWDRAHEDDQLPLNWYRNHKKLIGHPEDIMSLYTED